MLPSPALRQTLLRLVETLIIGAIGGAALGLAKFPAGWLSGAIISVAIAALARRPVRVPRILGQCANIVLGISLGASVTPDSVARMTSWPASLAVLALAMTAGSAFGASGRGFLRLCFARNAEQLETAMQRLVAGLAGRR